MVRTTRSVRTRIHKISSGCSVKLKSGTLLCDVFRQKWTLRDPIAAGGFGDIHLVSRDVRKNSGLVSYIAKVELITSGPLFVELNFYLRVGKLEFIDKWKEERGLKCLGMPHLTSFGSHDANGTRYRFLILDRYGPDIWSLFLKNDRRFSLKSILSMALQIIDVLEYIHYYGYVHADIKGANLVLGLGRSGCNSIYLIDYGLARTYVDVYGKHKEYVQDWRRAHNGTLEYTSRDAHVGAHSRRGDFEVLGYNLVQWLCGELPWESDLEDTDTVAAAKNMYMANTALFMNKCFPRGGPPAVIKEYINYVAKMSFVLKPDYEWLRNLFRKGLKSAGLDDDGKLQLEEPLNRVNAGKTGLGSNTENWKGYQRKQNERRTTQNRKPCYPVEGHERRTRLRSMIQPKDFDWVKVLQSHPERDAKPRTPSKKRREVVCEAEDLDASVVKIRENPLANPTPPMISLLMRKRLKRSCPSKAKSKHVEIPPSPLYNGQILTPAMEEVIRCRLSRGSNYQPAVTATSTRADRMRKSATAGDGGGMTTRKRSIPPTPTAVVSTTPARSRKTPPAALVICPTTPKSSRKSHPPVPTPVPISPVKTLRVLRRINYREISPEDDLEITHEKPIQVTTHLEMTPEKPIQEKIILTVVSAKSSRKSAAPEKPNILSIAPAKALKVSQWRPPTPPRTANTDTSRLLGSARKKRVAATVLTSTPRAKRLCRQDVTPSDTPLPRLRPRLRRQEAY